jgi:translation initiation factor 2B subunit (eIF-2B alpha/beta/delta family)
MDMDNLIQLEINTAIEKLKNNKAPGSYSIPAKLLTLQRGVTSTARHSENITCRGVTSTARHAALSHSFNYISTTERENIIGLLCSCS